MSGPVLLQGPFSPPPESGDTQPRGPRNGLGAVTFGLAILGALLAVFPATAVLGLLLCFVLIVPAAIAVRRIGKGTATNRRRSIAAMIVAPVFFLVAFVVVGVTGPPASSTNTETATSLADPATAPAVQRAPAIVAPASAPSLAPLPLPAAPVAVPPPAPANTPRAPAYVPPAPAPAYVPPPAPAPALPAPPAAGPSCDANSYINSSGNCVHDPVAAPSAPVGATAKCNDGAYSFSQHRQGTCSSHGGVGQWL